MRWYRASLGEMARSLIMTVRVRDLTLAHVLVQCRFCVGRVEGVVDCLAGPVVFVFKEMAVDVEGDLRRSVT